MVVPFVICPCHHPVFPQRGHRLVRSGVGWQQRVSGLDWKKHGADFARQRRKPLSERHRPVHAAKAARATRRTYSTFPVCLACPCVCVSLSGFVTNDATSTRLALLKTSFRCSAAATCGLQPAVPMAGFLISTSCQFCPNEEVSLEWRTWSAGSSSLSF